MRELQMRNGRVEDADTEYVCVHCGAAIPTEAHTDECSVGEG